MERKLLFYTDFSIIYLEGEKFIRISQKEPKTEKIVSYEHVFSIADADQKKLIPRFIRFITPNYEDLFLLSDGGKIKIIHSDGEEFVQVCKFIDDHHLYVGHNIFHICEFAERMERIKARIEKIEE